MKVVKLLFLAFFLVVFSCKKEQKSYTLMTYNIRYDNLNDGENQWSKRKNYLCEQIAFYNPSIFGIQEGLHHQVKYIDSTFVDYGYVGVGRDDGKERGEYSPIFYNSNLFKVVKNATFWLSESPNEISVGWDASMERICTYALFEDKLTKQQFMVFNTHFDHIGDTARVKSAELIIRKIAELNQNNVPVALIGDFNLKPESEPIKYLSKYLNDSREHSISKPFGATGTFNGFKFHLPVKDRIDYIFTSKNSIKVNKYAVLSDSKNCKYPSDHLPVNIEIEFVK
ncbi:endonuclease/exonuclease/phosphatase family protein [Maribacter sp.]|uniref:endonuclease/exonuclease/phosphatase family protein n=1 Tax=Maribacter sp. TaxID=1897614 RepID=UPI0025C2F8AA|nr:endonuclease/exonuclease/phosphatase family protein [Maribacter sp.]